jgi:hypothetical protein
MVETNIPTTGQKTVHIMPHFYLWVSSNKEAATVKSNRKEAH